MIARRRINDAPGSTRVPINVAGWPEAWPQSECSHASSASGRGCGDDDEPLTSDMERGGTLTPPKDHVIGEREGDEPPQLAEVAGCLVPESAGQLVKPAGMCLQHRPRRRVDCSSPSAAHAKATRLPSLRSALGYAPPATG